MAVTFHLPPGGGLGALGFATSPLFEAALSLRVLSNPKNHALLLPWVRRCRKLPDELREEIRLLDFAYGHRVIAGFFEVGIGRGGGLSFEDELAGMLALDPEAVLRQSVLTFQISGRLPLQDALAPSTWDDILGLAEERLPGQREILERAAADPRTLQLRLGDLLRRYWEEAFAEEWADTEIRLHREIERAARLLATKGVGAVFEGVLPEVRVAPDQSWLRLDKSCSTSEVDVAERGGLTLVPSVFGWPSVLVELDDPWPLFFTYPIAELQKPQAHLARPEVVETLRALGDDTRLSILALVAQQPRSTKELAELLRLSEPAVSRHLKQLSSVGILNSRREGYYVLYELDASRLEALSPALSETIGVELEDVAIEQDRQPRPLVLTRDW